jgi:hypothetical protein
MIGVFGTKKLHDDVFCLTQERDFFQSRYLEQVSQIQDMKQEMEAYRKEIDRLRLELLNQSFQAASLEEKTAEDVTLRSMTIVANVGSEKELGKDLDTTSQLGDDEGQCEENEREEEEEERESTDAIDIRQNAAKLLQWANYRTSVRTISVPGKVTKDQDEDSATESYSQSDRSAASIEY